MGGVCGLWGGSRRFGVKQNGRHKRETVTSVGWCIGVLLFVLNAGGLLLLMCMVLHVC